MNKSLNKSLKIVLAVALALILAGGGFLIFKNRDNTASGDTVTLGSGKTTPSAESTKNTDGISGGSRPLKGEDGYVEGQDGDSVGDLLDGGDINSTTDGQSIDPLLGPNGESGSSGDEATGGSLLDGVLQGGEIYMPEEYIDADDSSAPDYVPSEPLLTDPEVQIPYNPLNPDGTPNLNPDIPAVEPERTGPIKLVGKSDGAPSGASGGSISAGTYEGGVNMTTGAWHANPGCSYTLNGVGSPLQNGGNSLVEIRSNDVFVTNCAWKAGYPASSNSVSYGWHVVGKDMPAGTWQATGTNCAIGLMTDLRGAYYISGSEVFTTTREHIVVKNGDIVYSVETCGTWNKL